MAQRVDDLEDELEDFAIAVLLEEPLARSSSERVSLDELAAELGLSEFLAQRLRRAWALADHARALDQLHLLASELERSYPGAAGSLREGMEESLTLTGSASPAR